MGGKTTESVWDYLQIPKFTYAVFDIDCKIDQHPQFDQINEWLRLNEDKYKQLEWDADGQITPAAFVLCVYDHTNKFASDHIMEMWIPIG